MGLIKGITVTLHIKTRSGTDDFNRDKFTDTTVNVNNVLVGQPSTQEILDTTNLYGRKAQYILGIPKSDTHVWENTCVEFFGKKWRTFGMPIKGIEENVPGDWNQKVWVDKYD